MPSWGKLIWELNLSDPRAVASFFWLPGCCHQLVLASRPTSFQQISQTYRKLVLFKVTEA